MSSFPFPSWSNFFSSKITWKNQEIVESCEQLLQTKGFIPSYYLQTFDIWVLKGWAQFIDTPAVCTNKRNIYLPSRRSHVQLCHVQLCHWILFIRCYKTQTASYKKITPITLQLKVWFWEGTYFSSEHLKSVADETVNTYPENGDSITN